MMHIYIYIHNMQMISHTKFWCNLSTIKSVISWAVQLCLDFSLLTRDACHCLVPLGQDGDFLSSSILFRSCSNLRFIVKSPFWRQTNAFKLSHMVLTTQTAIAMNSWLDQTGKVFRKFFLRFSSFKGSCAAGTPPLSGQWTCCYRVPW